MHNQFCWFDKALQSETYCTRHLKNNSDTVVISNHQVDHLHVCFLCFLLIFTYFLSYQYVQGNVYIAELMVESNVTLEAETLLSILNSTKEQTVTILKSQVAGGITMGHFLFSVLVLWLWRTEEVGGDQIGWIKLQEVFSMTLGYFTTQMGASDVPLKNRQKYEKLRTLCPLYIWPGEHVWPSPVPPPSHGDSLGFP